MSKFYKTPIITSVVMLFLALFYLPKGRYYFTSSYLYSLELPLGYFTLLRIVVCGTAIYLAFIAKSITKISWVWTMGFIAILFNPFISIQLDIGMWKLIDVVVALIFTTGIFALSGEGATKSIFKTKAYKTFKKVSLVIFSGILAIAFLAIIISSFEHYLKKKPKNRIRFLDEQHQPVNLLEHFDIKTARPVDGYFIETYNRGEVILIGNNRDGQPNGLWKIYDKYGNLKAEKKYDRGVLIDGVKVFDENGSLLKKYPCEEGKIVGAIRLSDIEYVSDINVATRENVTFVNMDYEDENIKAKLLPPYWVIRNKEVKVLDENMNYLKKEFRNEKQIFFEVEFEIVNRTKIIENINSDNFCFWVTLRDNYNNLYSLEKKTSYLNSTRFGGKGTRCFVSTESPLKNAIYFDLRIGRDNIGNLNDIHFVFPAFLIREEADVNINNK